MSNTNLADAINSLNGILQELDVNLNGSSNKAVTVQKHTAGSTPNAEHIFGEGGFLADPCLDNQVVSGLLQPMPGFFQNLPMRPSSKTTEKFAIVTGLGDLSVTTEPDGTCDPAPLGEGGHTGCSISLPWGRVARTSNTVDVDDLLEFACNGDWSNFRFDPGVQIDGYVAMNGAPPASVMQNPRAYGDYLQAGAVNMQQFNVARALLYKKGFMSWNGDPANNTSGGGYKEFFGLDTLMSIPASGNYSDHPFVNNLGSTTECAINPDIKDFGCNCVCDTATVNGQDTNIYNVLQTLTETLSHRAMMAGYANIQSTFVMRAEVWSQLLKCWPCQEAGDGCGIGTINANDGANGLYNLASRNRMTQSKTITLNGVTYPVIIDQTIAVDADDCSSIYFIPVRNGSDLLTYIQYKDYRRLSDANKLGRLNNEMILWSDNGQMLWTLNQQRYCVEVHAKCETRLVFRAPHLSGRIDGVKACRLQPLPQADYGGADGAKEGK